MIYLCINSLESPNIPTMGFTVFHLEEHITEPCQATDYDNKEIYFSMHADK